MMASRTTISGLALSYQRRISEAYEAFYKSTWNAAWRGAAHHRLAEIDSSRRLWTQALDHIDRSLRVDGDNLNARNLKVVILRQLNRKAEADALLKLTCELDPLDNWSRYLATGSVPLDGHQRLDLGFDILRSNLLEDALAVFSVNTAKAKDGSSAVLLYALAHTFALCGLNDDSDGTYQLAAIADAAYVFPSRLEEIALLETAIGRNSKDARAPYYLGNLLYDRKRHEDAIRYWEQASELDPTFPTVWRNLGFAYYNVFNDEKKARAAFAQARRLAPTDARIVYEQDQLLKRTGESPGRRLAALEKAFGLVESRDDLSVELASLYNQVGRPDAALKVLLSRRFQPWEGGEGLVLTQYVRANLLLGQRALAERQTSAAIRSFEAAGDLPHSLSEAKHLLMNLSMIDYWLGVAFATNLDETTAKLHWERAARHRGDFQQMQVHSISEITYWSAQALVRLGQHEEARKIFKGIYDYSIVLEHQVPKIDYFATSLPTMLLFEEVLVRRQEVSAKFLRAQALLGLKQMEQGLVLLNEVRRLDENHAGAADLLAALELAVN